MRGDIFRTDLRTIQDWIIKRELLGTPGVAEVNSYGGFVKEYEVAINPDRLKSMNVTIPEIFDALETNNENTGSAYIEKNPNSYFIRGIGLAGSLEDVGKIVIRINPGSVPILVRDVADVRFGHAIRYGAFVCDTAEAVGGVVMMLKGANASRVVKDVKERMTVIEQSLPEGVYVEPYLDRTDLVERAIGTVTTKPAGRGTDRGIRAGADAGKPAGRADRGIGDPALHAVRHLHDEPFRNIRQPDEPRSDRFRAYRRRCRDHR